MLYLKLLQGGREHPVVPKLWVQNHSVHLRSKVLSITHGVEESRKLLTDGPTVV